MNKSSIIFSILTFFTLLISCEKEIELKLDNGQDKLVVNSLFYPDTNFRVYVTSTKLINENKNTFINNAEVKLYENGIFLEDLIFEADGWYISSFNPKYNTKYKIEVNHPVGNVYAESYVPDSTLFYGEYSAVSTCNDNYITSRGDYKLTIINNNVIERFYQTMELTIFQTEVDYLDISDPTLLADSEIEFNPKSFFFSNSLFSGDTNVISISKSGVSEANYFTSCETYAQYLSDQFIHTKTLSKEYYLFLKTWVKHRYNQNSDANIIEPTKLIFQGEPIEMYSNVVGGYGVFAGFNKTIVEFVYVP